MALDKPYCTIAQVQRETRNSKAADSIYEEAITLASRWIEDYCERDFRLSDHSADALRVASGYVIDASIYLPFPILTLTEVQTYAVDGTGEDNLAINDEVWWENKGQLGIIHSNVGSYPQAGGAYVAIKGTFGYTLEDTDPDLHPPKDHPTGVEKACILIAAAWSIELRKQEVGLDGGIQELLETQIPSEARRLLRKHRDAASTNF